MVISVDRALHDPLIPVFVKQSRHNGYHKVNKGWLGRWQWFRTTQMTNEFTPIGALAKWPGGALMMNSISYMPWTCLFLIGITCSIYFRQRREFLEGCDYGAAYFCSEEKRKVKFGSFWETKGVRKE